MTSNRHRSFAVGDRVLFRESTIDTPGVVIELLVDGYVRVRWANALIATTHRRHALEHAARSWAGPG